MSYNLIEAVKMSDEVTEQLGVVEFLRRLHRRRELPTTFAALGLDQLMLQPRDHVEVARLIRNCLADASDGLLSAFPEPTIWLPVQAQLEENGHPRMYFREGKAVDLTDLFGGRLERKRKYWFQAGFNITRG
jgi:hypothetical protein